MSELVELSILHVPIGKSCTKNALHELIFQKTPRHSAHVSHSSLQRLTANRQGPHCHCTERALVTTLACRLVDQQGHRHWKSGFSVIVLYIDLN